MKEIIKLLKKVWPYITYTVSFLYLTYILIVPLFFQYSIEELFQGKMLIYRVGMTAILMTIIGIVVKWIKKFINKRSKPSNNRI